MPVVRWNILGRLDIVEKDAGFVALNSRITEGNFPSSPAASAAARSFRTEDGMLDSRRAVFRAPFAGEQVGGGGVPSLEANDGQIGKAKSAESQSADARAIKRRLNVFVAEGPGALQVSEFALIPPDISVGLKLRQESESGIRRSNGGSKFVGKSPRLAVGDRAAERQTL